MLGALLLSGCGGANTDQAARATQVADAGGSGSIPCAQQGRPMARDCTVEEKEGDRGLILTLRHPDGAFHRLLVTKDGRGVIAADGAQAVKVSVLGPDGIEVALGGDRYRLPATIKGIAARP